MNASEHYRALHRIAEEGFCEFETKKYILGAIENMGCAIYEVGKTGVLAYFDFGKSTTSAFRAEMDALPITEKTGLPFASENVGCMHACGHDAHMAMLLSLAERLSKGCDVLCNVLLIFQPAEEKRGGAETVVSSPDFLRIAPERIFAIHLRPQLEKGKLFSGIGAIYAGSSEIVATFCGEQAHITENIKNDALENAARFYVGTKYQAKEEGLLIRFGRLCAGTAGNVTPCLAELCGTMRYFSEPEKISETEILLRKAKKYGGEVHIFEYAPPACNSGELFELSGCSRLSEPILCADDFSVYGRVCPRPLYMLLGTGDTPPLHSDEFAFDESILRFGEEKLFYIVRNEKISKVI